MAGQLLLVNPGPKKGRKKATRRRPHSSAKRPARRRSTTFARVRRRARRNPIAGRGLVGSITSQVMGAGLGALGAAALDAALRPLPLTVKTGNIGHLTRAGIALAAGIFGKRIPMVQQAAAGALTVTLYNVLRQYVTVPMNLGEISDADMQQIAGTASYPDALGTYEPAAALGYADDGMGAYEQNQLAGSGIDY